MRNRQQGEKLMLRHINMSGVQVGGLVKLSTGGIDRTTGRMASVI